MQSSESKPRLPWEMRAKNIGAKRAAIEADPRTPIEGARQFRRAPSDSERQFWSRTRNRRLGGFKIRRQVPIGPYIADFICVAARLVIEIDGDQHAKSAAYDAARTRCLERCGYRVMRIPTHEVLHDIAAVLDHVHLAIEERLLELRHR